MPNLTNIEQLQQKNPQGHFVDPAKKPDETLASLSRAEWEDWKSRFMPRLDSLVQHAQSGDLTQVNQQQAVDAMGRSFGIQRETQQRHLGDLGIQMSERQQAAHDRRMGVQEAAATASVKNQSAIAGKDRDMKVLAGSGAIKSGGIQ